MNKPYTPQLCVLALFGLLYLGSCSKSYDDSALKESIGKVEQRAGSLDALITRANTNIQALQVMAQSMAGQDYLESYSQDNAGNLILKFAKAGNITISQGTKGEDGVAPSMSIAKGEDGKYYWQINGQWMLNQQGQKVSAVPENGHTPRLKIEDGRWRISYDDGASWELRDLGMAVGKQGSSLPLTSGNNPSPVERIDESDSYYVKFVLRNGEEIFLRRERYNITMEVVGEVPDILFFGNIGRSEAPLKLRVRYTGWDYVNHIRAAGEGQIEVLSQQTGTEIRNEEKDERIRDIEINFRTTSKELPGLGLGSIVVDLMGKNSHLLKTMVIPIKSRNSGAYSRQRIIYMPPQGGTRIIPLLLGSNAERQRITLPDDSHFKFERRDDLLVVTSPMNTSTSTVRRVIDVNLLNVSSYEVQRIILIQNSFTYGDPTYELNLGAGQDVATQMSSQGYTQGGAIGQLKFKGIPNEQDFVSIQSFLGRSDVHIHIRGLDLSSLPIISLTSDVMEKLQMALIGNLILPKTLRTIGQGALSGRMVHRIELPDGLQTISWGAFRDFSQEADLIMPHSVTSLRGGAFDGCHINHIALSNGLKEVAEGVFYNAEISSVILPTSFQFKKIGRDAFYNCRQLRAIYCHQQTPPVLGARAFTNVASSARVYIPTGSKGKYLASDWAKYFRPSAFVEQANVPIAEEIFHNQPM